MDDVSGVWAFGHSTAQVGRDAEENVIPVVEVHFSVRLKFPSKRPDSACICDQTFSQCFIMPRDRKLCGLPLGMSLIL
ncbi:hypothetical protein QQP08_012956 [Theobroma cacao]|nr:hypothetical protein QQP08_012956 [Theobroma cacao]